MEKTEEDAELRADAYRIAQALSEIRIGRVGRGPVPREDGRLRSEERLGRGHSRGHHRQDHRGRGARRHGAGHGPAAARALLAIQAAGEPLSVGEIGTEIGVDQPRASRLVAQGVEDGLLVRAADPRDARRLNVDLTPAGRALARDILENRAAAVISALGGFTPEERHDLVGLLGRLAEGWSRA